MVVQALLGAAALASLCVGSAHGEVFFKETFSDAAWTDRWVSSSAKEDMGEWVLSSGAWHGDAVADQGMMTKDKARFYAISAKLPAAFSNTGQDLVVQYSVKNEGRSSGFCGGNYVKLMGSDVDQATFDGDTPYSVMFGGDMCGNTARIHTIFNYGGDNLLKDTDIKLAYADKNEFTHLYTLHVKPDLSYTVYFDMKERASGDITEDWAFPKRTVADPASVKPEDWNDEKMIDDATVTKPEGYDDVPELIADPDAAKPEDWDDEDDGEFEPPMVPNPEFAGEWEQPQVANPDYKGPWVAATIPNEEFDQLVYAVADIGTVGFELWVVENESIYDNIFIGNNLEEAFAFAKETFEITVPVEKAAKDVIDAAKEAKLTAERAAMKEDGDEDLDGEDLDGEDFDDEGEDEDYEGEDEDYESEEDDGEEVAYDEEEEIMKEL